MEQMMNDLQSGRSVEEGFSSFRSVGSLAAGWVARADSQRRAVPADDEPRFVPVAWAAE